MMLSENGNEVLPTQLIDVNAIVPSLNNKREITKEDIESMAESIKAVGLLQAILIRDIGKGFEIVFGECRWRAYKALGKESIPSMVAMEMSDEEAKEITAIENLKRKQLSPFEEAECVQSLIVKGADIKAISNKLGKTVSWVARRAKMNDLSKKWKKVMGDSSNQYSLLSPEHLEVIAKLSHESQDDIIDNGTIYVDPNMKVKELDKMISEKYIFRINSAPWNIDDETINMKAGACSKCSKRSSYSPNLFEDTENVSKNDRCLDSMCFGRKLQAYHELMINDRKKQYEGMITIDKSDCNSGVLPEKSKLKDSALKSYEVEVCKKEDEGAKPAYVIDGPGAGKVQWVKPNENIAKKKEKKTKPVTYEEMNVVLQKRRDMRILAKMVALLYGVNPEDIAKGKLISDEEREIYENRVVALCEDVPDSYFSTIVYVFGLSQCYDISQGDDVLTVIDSVNKTNCRDIERGILLGCIDNIIPILKSSVQNGRPDVELVKKLCTIFAIDFDDIYCQVIEEIPETKQMIRLIAIKNAEANKKNKEDSEE